MIGDPPHYRFPARGVDMFVRARRPIAWLCIVLLAPNMVACAHVKRVEPQTVIQPNGESADAKKIVGVTLKDGRDIQFDRGSRTVVRADSLHAQVGRQPLAIPTSDLQQVWLQSVNSTRTTLLVIGLVLVTLGVLMSIAVGQALDDLNGGF
jgi:hypothetical protein